MQMEFIKQYFLSVDVKHNIQEFSSYNSYRVPFVAGESIVEAKLLISKYRELIEHYTKMVTEEQIRKNNPAVAKAYDEYMLLLSLCD